MTKLQLPYFAGICCWISSKQNKSNSMLAISDKNSSIIRIYKPTKHDNKVIFELKIFIHHPQIPGTVQVSNKNLKGKHQEADEEEEERGKKRKDNNKKRKK
eukprot:TRINITY_DN4344_c0_g1_i1.p1 TRINITY_DN4344_c0_g1~~TRINITY_DN4344_c0_g1_i1.p1  ORF type:complete len:118 (-),score=18.02 TRINITY_DN4344_c0_g1_i1:61-363(-)